MVKGVSCLEDIAKREELSQKNKSSFRLVLSWPHLKLSNYGSETDLAEKFLVLQRQLIVVCEN